MQCMPCSTNFSVALLHVTEILSTEALKLLKHFFSSHLIPSEFIINRSYEIILDSSISALISVMKLKTRSKLETAGDNM